MIKITHNGQNYSPKLRKYNFCNGTLKIVEHIHEIISNKCEYFVQKASFNLVRTYDLITFEDLNVKGIINKSLSCEEYS